MNCSICKATSFTDFNNRINARCTRCGSLERHRAVYTVLENKKIINSTSNILHLAPEPCLVNIIKKIVKNKNYVLADTNIDHYKSVFDLDCVKLDLDEELQFDSNAFDLVLHNHVLEHLTGNHIDHLNEMIRITKTGGYVIFTIPFYKHIKHTVCGGELLSSDAERKKIFGQEDHYKVFGKDFLYHLSNLNSVNYETVLLDEYSSINTVFILKK